MNETAVREFLVNVDGRDGEDDGDVTFDMVFLSFHVRIPPPPASLVGVIENSQESLKLKHT